MTYPTLFWNSNPAELEIYITAKRWFQKSYGNTYHKVTIDIYNKTTKTWDTLSSEITYGYGDHFTHTAALLLLNAGIVEVLKVGAAEQNAYILARMFNDMKDIFFIDVSDVKRKKDL